MLLVFSAQIKGQSDTQEKEVIIKRNLYERDSEIYKKCFELLIKELSQLDVNKRPIHCSDLKRETLYIKENDVWEKDKKQTDKRNTTI